jgi:hypothetical protein
MVAACEPKPKHGLQWESMQQQLKKIKHSMCIGQARAHIPGWQRANLSGQGQDSGQQATLPPGSMPRR